MSGSKGDTSLLVLSSAPHIKSADGINKIMWTVIIALIPNIVYSVYIFGASAAILLAVSVPEIGFPLAHVPSFLPYAVFQPCLKRNIISL